MAITTKIIKADAIDDTLNSTYYEDRTINIYESSLYANDLEGYTETTTTDWWTLWLPYTTKGNYADCKIVSVQDATNGTVSFSNGVISFTPNANYFGPAEFTYTIKDSNGLTDTAKVKLNITNVNDTPEAFADNITANTTSVTIAASTLLANDKDADGNPLKIYSVQDAVNGKVTFDGTNVIFTPNAGYTGPASFRYTITDGQPGKDKDSATVNLTINKPVPVTLVNFDELKGEPPTGWYTDNKDGLLEVGTGKSFGLSNVTSNVVELERNIGDASNLYTLVSSTVGKDIVVNFDYSARPNFLTGTDSAIQILANGKVIDTVNANTAGFKSYQYTIAGTGETIRVEFKALNTNSVGGLLDNIKISSQTVATNTAPDAQDDAASGLTGAQITTAISTLLSNDSDANQDTLSITSVQNAVNGTVAIVNNNVVFTPTAGFAGAASYTYTVSDGKGGTDTATVNLTITQPSSTNTAPVATNDTIAASPANTLVVIAPATLLGNDKDVDGDTIQGVSIQNAVNGEVSYDGTNVIFAPTLNYSGPASFTYTITDGKGGTSTATVNLTINALPANIAPTATDDSATGNTNTSITLSPATLLANDSDIDGDAIQGVSIQDAVNGTVIWDGTNVIFTPTANYSGAASFTYTISDSKGATDTATVNLTIVAPAGTNTAPVATDDTATGLVDAPITTSISTLLSNDSDANQDTLSITSVQNAVNGTVAIVNNNVVFTPTAGFAGAASYTYTVSDGKGGTDTATVNLTVTEPTSTNKAPVASNDTIAGVQTDAVLIDPATLLANDEDLDGDTLEILDLNTAVNGFVGFENGKIVFTPLAGYSGPASFNYVVRDGKGGFDTATVNLTINTTTTTPDNTPPTAVNDTFAAANAGDLTFTPAQLMANDSDVDGDTFKIIDLFNPQNGIVYSEGTNIIFSPTAGYSGPASFTYTIQDSKGSTGTATVNLTVISSVGTEANDTLSGSNNADTMNGLGGNDTINGLGGNDTIDAGAGNDTVNGGEGNDTLSGALGTDTISGGAGNDQLFGGADDDTFVWTLADTTAAGIEADSVQDFGIGDVLNLADLLQGESNTADALDNYLHFDFVDGNTVISISTQGNFANGNSSGSTVTGTVDQKITLVDLDLTANLSLTDAQAIQTLLTNNALITN